MAEPESLLISGSTVITMNTKREVFRPGWIGIEEGRIVYLGSEPPEDSDWEAEQDASGCLALPGMINCHTHAAMTVMRGAADDLPLMDWLEQKVWPLESRMTPEDRYWSAKLAALEMIRAGITCFCDMSPDSDRVARAADEVGLRAVLSEVLLGTQTDPGGRLERAVEIARDWQGSRRIRFYLGPHALYTCPLPYLEQIIIRAAELSTGIQIHLSETAAEVARCRKEFRGQSPVEVLDEVGLFQSPTLAAHCVHLSDPDREILARRKVTAVHNPSSNMKLAAGVMGVRELQESGVNLALGTDSAASNNSLSILREMRLAALLQKVYRSDPTALPAGQVLELATCNGARAIGMEDRLGQLELGFEADLVLIRADRLHTAPTTDPLSQLVYSAAAADVDAVYIAGEAVLREGRFVGLDAGEVIARVREIYRRIAI